MLYGTGHGRNDKTGCNEPRDDAVTGITGTREVSEMSFGLEVAPEMRPKYNIKPCHVLMFEKHIKCHADELC